MAGGPNTAPISARVPVSHKVISSTAGYPVTPRTAFSFPSHARFRSVSGTLIDEQPSKATVRYLPNRIPTVDGCATGPASTSNKALSGAAPRRRRRSRSAFADGDAPSAVPVPQGTPAPCP